MHLKLEAATLKSHNEALSRTDPEMQYMGVRRKKKNEGEKEGEHIRTIFGLMGEIGERGKESVLERRSEL